MQEMDANENKSEQQYTYGRYTGSVEYNDSVDPSFGQKLDVDQPDRVSLSRQRFTLAIVSLCLLAVSFALLIVALAFGHVSGDGLTVLGAGMFFVCSAVIAVNGYFNRVGSRLNKQMG